MTTNTYGFNPQLNECIDEAFERIGIDPASIIQRHITAARRSAQYLFTEWSTQRMGVHQWCVDLQTQAIIIGQTTFTMPTGSIDILSAVLRQDDIDTEMYALSRDDYLVIPVKDQPGRPDRYFVDRGRDLPTVYLWPAALRTYDMVYWRLRQIQDVGGPRSTNDLPFRFLDAFVNGMAFRLAVKFNYEKMKDMKALYEQSYNQATEDDGERAPLTISYGSGQ